MRTTNGAPDSDFETGKSAKISWIEVPEREANLVKPWRRRFRGRVQKRMKNEERLKYGRIGTKESKN